MNTGGPGHPFKGRWVGHPSSYSETRGMFHDLSTLLTRFGFRDMDCGSRGSLIFTFFHLSTYFNHTPKVMDFGNRAMPSRNWGFAIHPSLPSAGVVHLMLSCLGTSLTLARRGLSATHIKEPIMIDIVFCFWGTDYSSSGASGPGEMYS